MEGSRCEASGDDTRRLLEEIEHWKSRPGLEEVRFLVAHPSSNSTCIRLLHWRRGSRKATNAIRNWCAPLPLAFPLFDFEQALGRTSGFTKREAGRIRVREAGHNSSQRSARKGASLFRWFTTFPHAVCRRKPSRNLNSGPRRYVYQCHVSARAQFKFAITRTRLTFANFSTAT